ncbi:MAG: maleylpyruvate isomerase family mycothiol-dependent enzyme, partial [Pseudomonadota bacterium]
LFKLLESADADRFDEPTLFKDWTINAVLQHLCFWNQMAGLQLTDENELTQRLNKIMTFEGGMRGFEAASFKSLSGTELVRHWYLDMNKTADLFAQADPKVRLKWAGPEMSARSSITARLMETWAHGQEVYDHLGVKRQNEDRIQN